MNINDGMVIANIGDESGLDGIFRVIQIFPDDDEVVLIEVPVGKIGPDGQFIPCYYATGFFIKNLSTLIGWMDRKVVKEISLTAPPLWQMSDDSIRKLYPKREGNSDSSMLLAREKRWALIEPILPENQFIEASQYLQLEKAASTQALNSGLSNRIGLDALHRYFAFGCIKDALITNSARSGAPEQPRIASNGNKLGRRNAAAVVGDTALQGLMLTEADRCNLSDGWHMFMRPGTTVKEAFLATCMAFYEERRSLKHGALVVELLPANLRPTEREFRYHGPKGASEEAAARRLMGEGEWLKNHRELTGTARSGVVSFGQLGSIDASPIDVNLVACFNALRPIGVGRGVFVTDVKCELILGWHVPIGGIGTKDANLAILNAALDKTALLKRYGLSDLPSDDFPSAFFTKLLSDNGELKSIKGMDANISRLGGKIEFIPSGRADRNSISESRHHIRHRRFDHHLPGTTHGRQSKRGETLPITKALLTHFAYCRLLILWIHWYNTQQEARHLLTIEMRRDNVKPTRIEIYRWMKKNGYVAGKILDTNYLRAHLLPTFTASIMRNGLVLHRPDKEKAVELLRGALFNDPYLAESGLIRSVLNGGKKHIEVSANPEDLSCVFYFDEKGVHVIPNISDDLLLLQEGVITDLCEMNDVDRQEKIEAASERDQSEAEMRSFRLDQIERAKRDKKQSMSTQVGTSLKADRASVRENQKLEKSISLDSAIERAAVGQLPYIKAPSAIQATIEKVTHESFVSRSITSVDTLQQNKLNKFHQNRGDK